MKISRIKRKAETIQRPEVLESSMPSWKQPTDPSLLPINRHPAVAATAVIAP